MQQFRKRFQRSRIPKYGSLNKGFTEQEIQKFFRAVDNPKFGLLFSYQAQLGLRIGEAVRINVKDIKFESRELVVKTEKAMTLDTLLIPAPPRRRHQQKLDKSFKNMIDLDDIMAKDSGVGTFLAIAAATVILAWAANEASKVDCQNCHHRHKNTEACIWTYP